MARSWTIAFLLVWQFAAYAGGDDAKAKYKKEILAALPTKPASLEVNTAVPSLVLVTATFDKDKDLGYKDLQYQVMYRLDGKSPRTLAMAIFIGNDAKNYQVLNIAWDAQGKLVNRQAFEDNKDKLAAVESRVKEIKGSLEKALGK
jgi:hypothetical protein